MLLLPVSNFLHISFILIFIIDIIYLITYVFVHFLNSRNNRDYNLLDKFKYLKRVKIDSAGHFCEYLHDFIPKIDHAIYHCNLVNEKFLVLQQLSFLKSLHLKDVRDMDLAIIAVKINLPNLISLQIIGDIGIDVTSFSSKNVLDYLNFAKHLKFAKFSHLNCCNEMEFYHKIVQIVEARENKLPLTIYFRNGKKAQIITKYVKIF